jgi:5-methylthioadenosine/S-adenosylhomocysteine deaminase
MPIVDTLIHARWVIPVVPHDTVLEDHVVAVHKTKIVAIFPAEELRHRAFTATNTYTLKEHVLMPGLVNAHTHLPMSLLRGYADDMKLMTWLNDHIWPAEKRWLNEEFSFDGAMLSGVEMLLSGTTCFNDHYPFGHVIADAAKQLRMRCRIGLFMIDHPTSYANNFDEYVSHAMQWHQDVANDPLISLALAPHSPYAMQDSSLKRLQQLQHELQLPVHMHLHETQDEIDHSMKTYGMRPLKRLAQHNLLSKKFTGVHLSC